jgi:hypothetical protein
MQVKKLPPMTKRTMMAAAGASALLMAGAVQAALQDRDLNGDTVVDAFYDTDLNITWLRDANVIGSVNLGTAVGWADGFSFAGYDDWRLPTSDTCSGYNCTGSEMGHLWYVELGNPAGGPMTNTGSFQNMQSSVYWSGTGYVLPNYAWYFYTNVGYQNLGPHYVYSAYYAMAVRPGDVHSVPELGSFALMLAGMTGLVVARWQRRRSGYGA